MLLAAVVEQTFFPEQTFAWDRLFFSVQTFAWHWLSFPEQTLAWHWLLELDNWFLLGAANLWRIPGIFALWFAVRCVAQTACDRAGVGEKGK